MGLYEHIRDTAKIKGYSINRLEQELGFARSSINKFNKNTPSADKLQKIAELLGVSIDYLLKGQESTERHSEVSTLETLAAHFDGDELSEEEMEEIMNYIEFVKSRRNK